jgi:hypothetical protein
MNFSNMAATKANALLSHIMSKIPNGRHKSTARNVIILVAHAKDPVRTSANLAVKTEIAVKLLIENLLSEDASVLRTWQKSTVSAM